MSAQQPDPRMLTQQKVQLQLHLSPVIQMQPSKNVPADGTRGLLMAADLANEKQQSLATSKLQN